MVKRTTKELKGAPERPPVQPGSPLGRLLAVLGEVAFLFAVIVLIELFSGDGRVGSFGSHPHPYWLVILPMAAARGLAAGLVAAAWATVLYVLGARRELGAEGLAELLTLETMLEPILFFGVSFLVGEFRDAALDRIRGLRKDLADAAEEAVRMREQRDVLAEAGRILERRLVDQSGHFGNLIETASRTERATPAEIREIALELVEEYCGASACVLLPRLDGNLELLCHRGWAAGAAEERLEAARRSEFVRRAVREGREINGFSAAEEPPSSGPLVVIPLSGGPGVIDALLCLDEVPPSLLNASTIRTFRAIARWTSALLTRHAREQEPGVPTSGFRPLEVSRKWIGDARDLGRRLGAEFERAVRQGLPLSFLAIRIRGRAGGESPTLSAVDEFVVDRFATRVRCSDTVYRFPRTGCYVMVLPGTPLTGAETCRRRLVPEDREEWQAPGAIEVRTMGPEPGVPDASSLVLQLAAHFDGGDPAEGERLATELATARHVGTLDEFLRALDGELGLAMRNEYPLQVLSLRGEATEGVEPGLLAMHALRAADRSLRRTDSVFAIGDGHVAIVLPNTEAGTAEMLGARLREAMLEIEGEPPYGGIVSSTLSFGPDLPWHGAFLDALSAVRPLRDVPVAGGYR